MKRYSVAGDVQDQSIDLLVDMMLLRSDTTANGGQGVDKTRGPKLDFERSMRPKVARSQYEFCG